MKEKDFFNILENAENDSMDRLIDKCPELSDEQLDRILVMSEKKFRKQMAQTEGTETESTIKMTGNDDVSGVEVAKRPAWLTPLATAASIVLIAGIAIGSTAMLRRNHKPGGGGGVVTPAVTVTTSGTGTSPSTTGLSGSVTVTTTTSADTALVTSLVPGGEDAKGETDENELLKPFAGRWVYQVSSGNYTVDKGAENIGTVEIRSDGTYTYTENNGNVTTDRVERTVDEIAGTQLVLLKFFDGTAIKFAATYLDQFPDQLQIGNGGLERLVREGAAEASAPNVTASWKTTYKQVLTDFMNSSEYTSDSMWDVKDIDNDGVPELLISKAMYHAAGVRIYYYENGNAVPIHEDDGTIREYGVYGALLFCPDEQLLGCYNIHMGLESYTESRYEGHKIQQPHFITNNVNAVGAEAAEYTINDVSVSKEEYDAALAQWNAKNWIAGGQQYYFSDLSPLN